ncbi:MAG: GNAT family N-acetyltransferase [Saprospiraceae bacterium]|nr:GNAT family N-acetyltransferase [Saprospiraceae bacterium]
MHFPQVEIRAPFRSDVLDLCMLGKTSFIESHGHSASYEDINSYTTKVYSESNINAELDDLSNIYHLLFSDGILVGYSKIRLNTPCDWVQQKTIAKLDRIYLLKEYYGQKIGFNLYEYNLRIARMHQQEGIWLYCWIENHRAISFYKRMGFEIVGNADFKISETHSNPNHIMYLKLI